MPLRSAARRQILPSAGAASFMAAYRVFNGTQNETDVLALAGALLSRQDVRSFLAGDGGGAVDAELVLCSVLFEASPAGLAAFAGQGAAEEALVGRLLGDTALMRDMLLAGGAKGGMYGEVTALSAHPRPGCRQTLPIPPPSLLGLLAALPRGSSLLQTKGSQ